MITPIELIDNIYYKRDDYFKPFGDYHVNGEKARQALIMFENYIDDIDVKELILSNGMKVIIKQTEFKNDEILFTAFTISFIENSFIMIL